MNRRGILALVVVQVGTTIIVLLLALGVWQRSGEVADLRASMASATATIDTLRAQLADARTRLGVVESERDRLQARIDLLEQALRDRNVDPGSIQAAPTTAPTRPTAVRSPRPTPKPQPTPSARPRPTQPPARPSPTPTPGPPCTVRNPLPVGDRCLIPAGGF